MTNFPNGKKIRRKSERALCMEERPLCSHSVQLDKELGTGHGHSPSAERHKIRKVGGMSSTAGSMASSTPPWSQGSGQRSCGMDFLRRRPLKTIPQMPMVLPYSLGCPLRIVLLYRTLVSSQLKKKKKPPPPNYPR